ncbi:MAG: hypothetical protein ACM30G_10795 [Micromonosporaceae bacterium]
MSAVKHPSVRARRNRTSTAATLSPDHDIQAPPLPDRPWHPQTLAWWADVWASPMAPEYDESDKHGLFVLAVLVDSFWRKPHWTAAAEIRLQRQCFGLTPMDRRRLQWEIDRGEAAAERTRARRPVSPAKLRAVDDPRRLLA